MTLGGYSPSISNLHMINIDILIIDTTTYEKEMEIKQIFVQIHYS